jgi:hypothetical protein
VFGTSIGILGKLSFLEPMRPYLLGEGRAKYGSAFFIAHLLICRECS